MTVPRSLREPPASLCARVVRGRSATAYSAPSPRTLTRTVRVKWDFPNYKAHHNGVLESVEAVTKLRHEPPGAGTEPNSKLTIREHALHVTNARRRDGTNRQTNEMTKESPLRRLLRATLDVYLDGFFARAAFVWSQKRILLSRAGRRELVTSQRRVCPRGYRKWRRIQPVASVERPTATRTTGERRRRSITMVDHDV